MRLGVVTSLIKYIDYNCGDIDMIMAGLETLEKLLRDCCTSVNSNDNSSTSGIVVLSLSLIIPSFLIYCYH
jgi:hypothetical protein